MTNPYFKSALTREEASAACTANGWALSDYAGKARVPSLVTCLSCGNMEEISITAIKQGRRCGVCRGHGEEQCPLSEPKETKPPVEFHKPITPNVGKVPVLGVGKPVAPPPPPPRPVEPPVTLEAQEYQQILKEMAIKEKTRQTYLANTSQSMKEIKEFNREHRVRMKTLEERRAVRQALIREIKEAQAEVQQELIKLGHKFE